MRRLGVTKRLLLLLGLGLVCFTAGSRPGAGLFFAQEPAQGKKYALLVGVDKYEKGSLLPGLPFPRRDVEELAKVFLQAGYEKDNVVIMTKEHGLEDFDLMPTAEHIRNQFQLLLAQLKPCYSIIVALAGHGVLMLVPADKPEEKPRGKSFFCPMDANLARKQLPRFIDFDELYKGLADSPATVKRAAVSKLLNSLSHEREIARPEAIDAGSEVILHVDLRAYGWEPDDWVEVEKANPYGVLHVQDREVLQIEQDIARLAATRLPVLRGDWFVATVSRPPLYDRLLRLPESLKELEKTLGVNFERNFEEARLKRGGLITSGVSRHNRLVERHPTPFGAYWRSYDFKQSAGRGNLLEFPLGPRFPGNRFDDQAFEQAGGEVIFNLPNGLQGYMLADAKDRRLDVPAPVAIVSDRSETSGTPEIVNGLSCMA